MQESTWNELTPTLFERLGSQNEEVSRKAKNEFEIKHIRDVQECDRLMTIAITQLVVENRIEEAKSADLEIALKVIAIHEQKKEGWTQENRTALMYKILLAYSDWMYFQQETSFTNFELDYLRERRFFEMNKAKTFNAIFDKWEKNGKHPEHNVVAVFPFWVDESGLAKWLNGLFEL